MIESGWGVSEQKCRCFYLGMTIQLIAPQVHAALASKQRSNRRRRTTWQYIQWPRYNVGHNLGLRVRPTRNNISTENYWLSTYGGRKQCDRYKHCGRSCDQLPPQDLINVTAHTMTSDGHVTSSVTWCHVMSCVKRPPNSNKNCWRSILNVVTSQLWRHRVTWRHRWRHHSTPLGNFPIDSY